MSENSRIRKCKTCKHFKHLYFEDGQKSGVGLCCFEGLKKRKPATTGILPTKCPHWEFGDENWLEFDREKRREKECRAKSRGGIM